MRRLDGLSAFMVRSDLPRAYQHTLKIAVMNYAEDPSGYRFEKIIDLIEDGLHAYPHLKWKIAKVPFGLNHPYWVQDLEFDISHHVRRIACPAPGDKAAFCTLISELYAQQLPKDLPLWVIWIVEGLENDEVGMVALFHHAYSDGVGVSIMLEGLANPEKRPQLSSEQLGVDSRRQPGKLSLLVHGLLGLPAIFIREIPYLVRSSLMSRKMERALVKAGQAMPPSPGAAPDSPFNVALSHRRTFYYDRIDLPEFRALSKQFGVSINDLLLSAVCGAVRRYYQQRELATDTPLVATIPFDMRTERQRLQFIGNYVANCSVSLPIHLASPLEQLAQVQKSAQSMKAYMKATGGGRMSFRVIELVPPLLTDLLSWLLQRGGGKLHPFGNIIVSNVPGPGKSIHVGAARVTNWLSTGQLPQSLGLNITAWSYVDTLNVCMMADQAVVPDGKQFMDYLEAAIQDYRDLAGRGEHPAD